MGNALGRDRSTTITILSQYPYVPFDLSGTVAAAAYDTVIVVYFAAPRLVDALQRRSPSVAAMKVVPVREQPKHRHDHLQAEKSQVEELA
jgi:hypothetical protein